MSLENVGNYLESMENAHILFLHETRSKGEDFEFNFIKKGLEKAEHCCYSTNEPEEIRRRMSDYGIDVEKYEKRNLLDIFSTPNSLEEFSKMAEEEITTNNTTTIRPEREIQT